MRCYLPLIQKVSSTHMHGITIYVKEGLPFSQDFSRKLWLALLHSVSYFFFLYWSPSFSLFMVFYSIWSNIGKVLSINLSANMFVFGDFNIYHKDRQTHSVRTDGSGEFCYNFFISNNLIRMVNFPIGSQTVILTVLLFWISFFLVMLVLQWHSLHWEILIMLSQSPLTFHQIHNKMPCFIT